MKKIQILVPFFLLFSTYVFAQKYVAEEIPASEHLIVNGNIITVKNWGAKFDGDYDIVKLAKDSCASGNCINGNGRKITASIKNGNPSICIMEGKFKDTTFLGAGVMLIDGQGDVLDGTYDLGKFKVNYQHNSLSSKTIFHSKFTKEDIVGNYSGYVGFGIGSATSEYRRYVVGEFIPDYDAKPLPACVWRTKIFEPAYNKWFYNDPIVKANLAKQKAYDDERNGIQNVSNDGYKTYIFKSQCNSGGKTFYVISKISADISKYPFDQIKNEAINTIQHNGWVLNSSLDYLGVVEDVKIEGKAGKDYAVSESGLYTIKKN